MPRARAKGKAARKPSSFYDSVVDDASKLIEANEIEGID